MVISVNRCYINNNKNHEKGDPASMKKLVTMAVILALTCVSAACGNAGSKKTDKISGKETAASTVQKTAGDNTKKKVASADSGKTVYSGTEGLTLDPVYENPSLNLSKETGPIKYTITGIQVAKAAVTDEDIAGEMELLPGQEFTTVAFNVTVENTSDKPSSIYFSESSPYLTTNTQKDILPDMWLSDNVNEDYEPHETKTATIVFALLHTKADKVNKVSLTVSAPYDTVTYEDAGEETTVEYSW